MFQRLPSLPALRTFEAAARLKSFKAAADELGVSPTAVSHQIRTLEETLGLSLFTRHTRAIALTEAGEMLAPDLHDALSLIRDGIENITAAETVVTVTTTPAFAALVMAPQLGAFQKAHPDISIQINTGTRLTDLARERRIDIAVRYGMDAPKGVHVTELADEAFRAYGAPDLLARLQTAEETVLFETDWQQSVLQGVSWSTWFQAAGEPAQPGERHVSRFDEEHYGLQAAMAGQGLTLASSVLARDMIARGLLSEFRPEISLPGASYRAICLQERARARKVRLCLSWLQEITSG